MKIRLASKIQMDSIVDGPGIRTVIWTQGCTHNCFGCHNKETHDINAGFEMDTDDLKEELKNLKKQDGITLSGGDPMMQPKAILEILKYIKELNINVWCYTGYVYEDLIKMSKVIPIYKEILESIDVLVDGKFMMELKSYNCKFRGSSNQRIIDVKRSLELNKTIVLEEYNAVTIDNSLYKKPEYLFV